LSRVKTPGDGYSRGAILVEFALIFPILIALIFGIVDFGRAYDAKQALTHATREAVREYAVSQDQSDGEAAFWQAVGSLDAGSAAVTVPSGGCTEGEPVTVTATYEFNFLALPFASITLDSTGVMRCGG
jgi:Flp pilus assembly protein TadG